MKIKIILLIVIFLSIVNCILPVFLFSQTKWQKNPFEHKVFIENKGQFPETENIKIGDIKYAVSNAGQEMFFTPQGLTYRHNAFKHTVREALDKKEKSGEDEEEVMQAPVQQYVSMTWLGANPDAKVIAEDEVSYYFTYPDTKDLSGKSTLKAKAFKKIIYKNIYPNIDVEYIFPENKPGIKYSIILHPGADPAVIKMKYENALAVSIDNEGNVVIKSPFGDIIDHAPKTFFASDHQTIPSSFSLINNTVSFLVASSAINYQPSNIVIDPWTTNPSFTNSWSNFNSAYDVDYDNRGNVYVYGGAEPFQEIQFNSAGVIQWVFTHSLVSPYWFGNIYGDFAVDHNSGSSYIAQGVGGAGSTKIAKLNSAGGVVGYFMGTTAPYMDEIWRIAFNNCTHQAIIGTANHNSANPAQAAMLDTNLSTMTFVNVLSAPGAGNDPCLLAIDNSSNCYMAIAQSVTGGTFDNMMLRFPANTFFPTAWIVSEGYAFREVLSVTYVNNQTQGANGFNGMAVNSNFLYTYDGATLKKWNKATGALLGSVGVTGSPFNWGGLDVDDCDNIFVGTNGSVKQYDVNLNLVNTIPVTSDVYDVKIGPMNKLYVCGKGFVSELHITSAHCSQITLTSSATGTSCNASTGSATVTATGGTAPYTYLWNPNGQTNATATGLSPGTYIVTVIDNSCNPKIQMDTVVVTSIGGFTVTNTQSNIDCNGGSNGSVTATVTGGTSPYTYNWSPGGGTNATTTGLSAGNYTVIVTDATGCVQQLLLTITQPTLLTSTATATNATCGNTNGSATVTASGGTSGYTYSWNPSAATTSSATGLSSGTYSVTITDANGCSKTNTVTVSSTGSVTATISSPSTICAGQTVTLNSSGGINYSWSNGQMTSSIAITPTTTTTYSVIVSSGNCADTAFVTVTVNSSPNISVSGNTVLCTGDMTTLTASGGTNYSWNTGNSTSVITVSPSTTTTYTVASTNGSCAGSASVTVVVSPPPIASVNSTTICSGQNATLTASGGTNYTWSNGNTTNQILVAPTTNTTYSVVVSIGSCKDTTSATVTVNPVPTATAWNSVTIASGSSTTLAASGGGTYTWSNGVHSPLITVSPPVTTIYCVAVTKANCTDTACVTVTVEPIDCSPSVTGELYLPNAFSPNGDGENDILQTYFGNYECIQTFELHIYNRWGEQVFETTDPIAKWDGTYKGKLENSAVFIYYMKATLLTGEKIIKKGNISLIR